MILGASFDSEEENRAFRDKFNFPYDLLCDTGKSMGNGLWRCGRFERPRIRLASAT